MNASTLSHRTTCGRPGCTNELTWYRRAAHQKYCRPECARLHAKQITPTVTNRPLEPRYPISIIQRADHICALHLVDLVDPRELETLADRLQQHPGDPDHAYQCASEWLRQEANRRREGRY